ncbi:MAG: hypothetical protein L0Z53_21675, partial [Acidobacteriales bacterium]|nr:hypothetical protein [Terriglobales bacterium]
CCLNQEEVSLLCEFLSQSSYACSAATLTASAADAAKPKASNRVLVKLRAPMVQQVEATLPDSMTANLGQVANLMQTLSDHGN